MIVHPFEPVISAASRILVLGSFPSAASRDFGFYYGHPRNRFWPMLSLIWGEPIPCTPEERAAWVISHGLALWDVLRSCTITGSDDASIRDAVVNDIPSLLSKAPIERILLSGQTAGRLFQRHIAETIRIEYQIMPSTSPANAAWSLARLAQVWGEDL